MILKGSQRAGAGQLAAHLLKIEDNDHVELHELRGFASDNLSEALQEAYAVSRGTRCKQFLFSLSLNPPQNEDVSIEAFEAAIERTEAKLGLHGHPRAIVFHEKEGRRHAHCVWSRIDTRSMTAVNLPHFKRKLQDVSKSLYLEHGWQMPSGFVDRSERDPFNFTHAEWEQAKRSGQDPRAIKAQIHECWAVSDGRQAFVQALSEKGFALARGDRRGFVAVDHRGEVYSVARAVGQKTKEIQSRLGDPASLSSLDDIRARIADRMTDRLYGYAKDQKVAFRQDAARTALKKADLVQRQRAARDALRQRQAERQIAETKERASRFSKGIRGIWHRLTGKHAAIKRQNQAEAEQAKHRDQAERNANIAKQMAERRTLQKEIVAARQQHAERLHELRRDVSHYRSLSPNHQDRIDRLKRGRDQNASIGQRPHDFDLER